MTYTPRATRRHGAHSVFAASAQLWHAPPPSVPGPAATARDLRRPDARPARVRLACSRRLPPRSSLWCPAPAAPRPRPFARHSARSTPMTPRTRAGGGLAGGDDDATLRLAALVPSLVGAAPLPVGRATGAPAHGAPFLAGPRCPAAPRPAGCAPPVGGRGRSRTSPAHPLPPPGPHAGRRPAAGGSSLEVGDGEGGEGRGR